MYFLKLISTQELLHAVSSICFGWCGAIVKAPVQLVGDFVFIKIKETLTTTSSDIPWCLCSILSLSLVSFSIALSLSISPLSFFSIFLYRTLSLSILSLSLVSFSIALSLSISALFLKSLCIALCQSGGFEVVERNVKICQFTKYPGERWGDINTL